MATREIPQQDNRNPDFAALTPQQRREIASQGGRVEDERNVSSDPNPAAAHEGKLPQGSDKSTAFNPQETAAAARRDGQSIQGGGRRGQHMAELGKGDNPHQDHGKNR